MITPKFSHTTPILRSLHWLKITPSSFAQGTFFISSDEKLFNKILILTCPNHILRTLLPPPTAQNYSLRNRPHNRQLPDSISRITDCNFTVRMLYRNMYWRLYTCILDMRFVLFLCTTAVWQFAINEYVMLCYLLDTTDRRRGKKMLQTWTLENKFLGFRNIDDHFVVSSPRAWHVQIHSRLTSE